MEAGLEAGLEARSGENRSGSGTCVHAAVVGGAVALGGTWGHMQGGWRAGEGGTRPAARVALGRPRAAPCVIGATGATSRRASTPGPPADAQLAAAPGISQRAQQRREGRDEFSPPLRQAPQYGALHDP